MYRNLKKGSETFGAALSFVQILVTRDKVSFLNNLDLYFLLLSIHIGFFM